MYLIIKKQMNKNLLRWNLDVCLWGNYILYISLICQ